jgi:hypothetical protein
MPAGDKKEGVVDLGLWLSILSLVLVIPLGIASNLLTPRLVAYLDRRKLLRSHQTKEQDVAAYKRIEAFRNGTRDKYSAYIGLAVLSVNCAIGCAVCVLLLALGYGHLGTIIFGDINPAAMSLYLVAVLFFLLSVLWLVVIAGTERRIQKFGEYTAEMRKKWGDDVV